MSKHHFRMTKLHTNSGSRALRWAIGVLLVAWNCQAQELPPPPQAAANFPEWEAVNTTATAQGSLRPMEGSPQVAWDTAGYVRLPVSFADTRQDRVSWDFPVKADLRLAKGVRFDFYCGDLTPVAGFSFYFRSGDGWYGGSFSPEQAGGWQRIVINKADTRSEGNPAGWGTVDTLRISAWRAGDRDTVCAIANLGLNGDKPEALVVRADSNAAGAGGEARSFGEFAATLSGTLDALGVASTQVTDTDLAAELLREVKLVVLPYNPRVAPEAVELLRTFTAGGGKLLVCYSLAAGVDGLLGLQATDGVVAPDGVFAGFSRTTQGLPGQPAFAPQASWRTTVAKPTSGKEARVLAVWRDGKGHDTTLPALTLTPTGAFFGHVWLHPSGDDGLGLMRAVVGELIPDLWRQAAATAFAQIGVIDGAGNLEALAEMLKNTAPEAAREALAVAAKAQSDAARLMREQRWTDSVAASQQATAAAARAWFLTQTPRPGEHRAFWCHSAFGLGVKNWDESIRLLRQRLMFLRRLPGAL